MWSSSSIPTEAAWAVLKRDGGHDNFDYTQVMDPADVKAAAKYFESLPLEKQMIMQQINEAFHKMPDNAKGQLLSSAHDLIEEHRGRLGEALESAPDEEMPQSTSPGTFKITKFIPIVVGVVFALDALNQSQGGKASLVGNVFTDTGNAISSTFGGDPEYFGKTNYSDIFDYDSSASYINPITGQPIGDPIENPSTWDRLTTGTVSALGTFLNPFAAAGAIGRTSGRVGSSAKEGLGRLGAQATKKVGEKTGIKGIQSAGQANADRIARVKAARQQKQGEFFDRTGGTGKYGKASRLGGAGSKTNMAYRTLQGAGRNEKMRQVVAAAAAGLAGSGGSPNISGTASATPSAGGGGAGVGGVGNRASAGLADQDIFSGKLEQQRAKAGAGGYGTNKGDNMKIGEQILKTVTTRMNNDYLTKGKCPECGKEHIAKMGCTAKADKKCPHCDGDAPRSKCICGDTKKASKKPAHGMIIVLGAQGSGPGPSKDGKRTKK